MKKGVICLVLVFHTGVMVPKWSKYILLQFRAKLSNQFKSVIEIYIYSYKKSRYALLRNGDVSSVVTYCFEDTRV